MKPPWNIRKALQSDSNVHQECMEKAYFGYQERMGGERCLRWMWITQSKSEIFLFG